MGLPFTKEEFIKFLLLKLNRSPKHIRVYERKYEYFYKAFQDKKFDLESIDEYIYQMQRKGSESSTINDHIKWIRNFLKFMKAPYIDEVIYKPDVEKQRHILTKNEILSIFACKPKTNGRTKEKNYWYSVILHTLAETGMRITKDLSRVTWSDISEEYIMIQDSKNKLGRFVAITPILYEKILKLPHYDHGYVFRNGTNKLHDQKINKELKVRAKQCGINKSISTHTFRRTIATVSDDIRAAAEQLGHKNLNTTFKYNQQSLKRKKELVESLPITSDYIDYNAISKHVIAEAEGYRQNKNVYININQEQGRTIIEINDSLRSLSTCGPHHDK